MSHALKRSSLILSFFLLSSLNLTRAQRFDIDLLAGISNYQGDLQPLFLTFNLAKPAAAAILKYGINDNIFIRGGFSFGTIAGDDRYNRDYLKSRNLSFRSSLQEVHLGLEYRIINPENFAVTPYVFAGIGAFHFDPYTNYNGNKVFLHTLNTEGQGLPQYPEKKPYSLTQFCFPYGGGIKWQVNCNFNIGIEFGHRKLFTDYLDDVSGTYADETVLRNARGQLAVDIAYRRDELDPTRTYPQEGTGRGNPKLDDWYYFTGITLGLSLNDCETGGFSLGGLFKGQGRNRSRTGCPTNVW